MLVKYIVELVNIYIYTFWQLLPGWHAELHIMSFFLHVHFFDVQFVRQVQRRYPCPVPTDSNRTSSRNEYSFDLTSVVVKEQYFVVAKLFRSSHVFRIPSLVAIRNLPSFSSITTERRLAASPRPRSTDGIIILI